ncbi:DegT/DnrJ/EryC1/StrS family aminotransferase [Methylomarinum vadi]|uniref:DegT/DnrJ/EryC1/StrS family aminotransferase n=1 Tax=Methylomarinum vadi TaxID=438855 RepID=UPI0004DF2DB9|nr:DegT/DnrJ/EryC1/StrS family aminotransferase [Methylomarinum vadi]
MINVTKPFLPPQEEYKQYIDEIWQRAWLTNNGPLVNELELKLKKYLNLKHLLFLNNGTMALQLAIKALNLTGEIITTPFSYVATTSSIVWQHCKPVFVDIDSKTLNINPQLIEQAITPNTSAILATHVFGNPCDIDAIEAIAKKHNLKTIYDAAHCFGTTYKGESVLNYGDISCISFHATKLFHTIEGGAVATQKPELLEKMAYLRNFGHNGPYEFNGVGINGKNSEFHAAMGLCNLNYIEAILDKRKKDSLRYDKWLADMIFQRPEINPKCNYNYAYYSVIFSSESECVGVLSELNKRNIFSRRYFYPSLSTLNYVPQNKCKMSEDIASRILCLPLYYDLSNTEIDMICRYIKRYFKSRK